MQVNQMKYANFRKEHIIGVSYSDIAATDVSPACYVLCVYIKDISPVMLTYTNEDERNADYKAVCEILNEPLI